MGNLGKFIDHTLLKPNAKKEDFLTAAQIAKDFSCASLCIPSTFLELVHPILDGTDIALCTVIGFPLGYSDTHSKLCEATFALDQGATEIDMVMNIAYFLSGDYLHVSEEIEAIANKCHTKGAKTKVIIETAYLTDEQKVKACHLVEGAGAEFVKTSTGFASNGATLHDVQLMQKTVGTRLGIKAAGGIQDKATMLAMIEAGATRIGTSRTATILGDGIITSDASAY